MRRTIKLYILQAAVMLFACTFGANAQTIKVNPKFGNVSKAELEMTEYAPDTSAVAVILYKGAETEVDINLHRDNTFAIIKKVHERIKVLKEPGTRYANFEFGYTYTNSLKEEIKNIKVETYNLVNGKTEKTKMSKKFKFDEKFTENVRRVSFTAENVKVGSVIEVEYTFESPNYTNVPDLVFQTDIPINQVVETFSYPEYFTFKKTQRSLEHLDYSQSEENASEMIGMSTLSYRLFTDKFSAVDMPAMVDENLSFNSAQYRSRVIYDLGGVYIPGVVNKTFNKNWAAVDHDFIDAGILKDFFAKYRDKDELLAAVAGIEEDEAKIAAVVKFVADRVKWNDDVDKYPSPAKDVLKKGTGDSADINALVASALNTIGYKAEPVFLRRRTRGILVIFQITASAFDALMIKVTAPDNSKVWYLDGARKDGYLNVLPAHYLVEQARLINESEFGEWVDLRNLSRHKIVHSIVASLDETGLMTGTAKTEATGAYSYSVKAKYHGAESQEAYLEALQNRDELDELSEFQIDDSYGPTASLSYQFEKEYSLTGDKIYFKPFLSKFHSESYFRKETRKIPIDFEQPEDFSYIALVDLPEGWEVEEMPEPIKLTCPPVNAKLVFTCQNMGGKLIVRYNVNINEMVVAADHYADLRAFWEQLVNIEKSVIVLKKSNQ